MKVKKIILLVISTVFFSSLMFSAYVKVKSPNGGETWQLGSEKLITWEKSGDYTHFRIILRKANKRVGDIALNLGPNSTSYLWKKVGEYIGGNVTAGSDYKIRVRAYFPNGVESDDSDLNFSIISKSKSRFKTGRRKKGQAIVKKIRVLSPKGGNYETGQKLPISWTTNWKTGSRDIFYLDLYSGSGKKFKRNIGKSKPGFRSLNWPIPGDVWPEFYTIRVSQGNCKALSGRFHISRSYAGKPKFYIIKGKVVNGWRINKYDPNDGTGYSECKKRREQEDSDPGPGVIRVGYSTYRIYDYEESEFSWCYNYYRSFVYFNLKSAPRQGILVKAELKYNKQVGGCAYSARVYALDRKWGKNSSLFSVKATYHADPADFRDVVNKWLAFPNANYGLVFVGPAEKTRDKGKTGYKRNCLLYYDNVRLVLTFKEQAK
ncbi:MAG: hypothetical protein KAW12_02490 [Candidatus Aminicenantes bacterium]|nr:hypothetical protein [Candidatus Aminicenantes bacterium]